MLHILLRAVLLLIWIPACSDPKCPPDFVEREGRCKHCPPGSEPRHDECISVDGGAVVEPVQTGSDAAGASPEAGLSPGVAPPLSDAGGAVDAASVPLNTSSDAARADDAGSSTANMSLDDAGSAAIDAGTTPVDPCHGTPQCSACTSDSQCPEPGDCLVKHCNIGKSICEPTFAAAQTSCGTSKCDGNGKCVGCLNDNDCGAPGECKVRYCNPSTHVCEPKNAPATATCPTGHCDQGVCVQCSSTTECADKTCQTKSCSSGQCRYTNVPEGQKGNCATGLCTATQVCRECVGDEQCTRFNGDCTMGRCAANTCTSEAKTGSCGPLKMCSGGSCVSSCGNRVVDTAAGEQCDATAPPQDYWACDLRSCKLTGFAASSYRKRCPDGRCASNEMCVTNTILGVTGETGPICIPNCDGPVCPKVSDYVLTGSNGSQTTACSAQFPCFLKCVTSTGCPPGLTCNTQIGVCAGPFY
jgi:hypothetical protein